ncbi:MAG: CatB-related O-acetyltransferase [Acetobacteraceae bacterium]|nr:CatB-related O-acetyltransferase [Acetobacteraceae bacterium]MDW8399386.1 CatB-related O-acetyltransferase [Acetobacteraceae bacterium]
MSGTVILATADGSRIERGKHAGLDAPEGLGFGSRAGACICRHPAHDAAAARAGFVPLRPPLARSPQLSNRGAGAFGYRDDFDPGPGFLSRNLACSGAICGAGLRIGGCCAIAHGARFVMPDANRATAGPSIFPFAILGGASEAALPPDDAPWPPARRTVIGNDAWIGMGALVLQGATIGRGAVIGAGAVVASDVPGYATAAGNPVRVRRTRFDAGTIARLKRWPPRTGRRSASGTPCRR